VPQASAAVYRPTVAAGCGTTPGRAVVCREETSAAPSALFPASLPWSDFMSSCLSHS
jgi:hypothetical protein